MCFEMDVKSTIGAAPLGEADQLDYLIRATEQPRFPELSPCGSASISVGDERTFEATLLSFSQTVQGLRAEFDDAERVFFDTNMGEYGSIAPIFSARGKDREWQLGGGFLTGRSLSSTYGTRATVRFSSFEEQLSESAPRISVAVFTGAPAGINFPDEIPVPEGVLRPWFLERGMRCRVLGCQALIRSIEWPELADYGTTLAIAWAGPPLHDAWPRALRVLLTFLFGTWLEPIFQYTTDEAGRATWFHFNSIPPPSFRKATPPIDLHLQFNMKSIGDQFDEMLRRCMLLLSRDVPLDVSLGHLFAEHDGLGIEIRDIAVALDSLVESPLFDVPRRKLVTDDRLRELSLKIMAFFRPLLKEEEADFERRVGNVLALAQYDTTGDRRRKFWETLDVALSEDELSALKHRNTMSHKGYIDFDHSSDSEWQRLVRDSSLLRTLVNRVILGLLGFHGHAVSYVNGRDIIVHPAKDNLACQNRGVDDL